MSWTVWTNQLTTAELTSNLNVYQRVVFHEDVVITSMQSWFTIFNNPTFTDIYMRVYSLDGTTPRKLIYTSSNVQLKADVHTLAYAIKGLRFDFDNVVFKAEESYAFVPRSTGYVGTDTSYIGWKLGFPDPAYRTNVSFTSLANIGSAPADITGFLGAEL